MKLVTVATKTDGYFSTLQDSCKRFNVQLDVLGWNQKWLGFAWKLQLMQQYLSNLPDSEIVCFIDGYDVIMLRSLEDLETEFKIFLTIIDPTNIGKIIIGCENSKYRILHLLGDLVFKTCHGKAINSGTYIGYVKNLKLMLNSFNVNPGDDDQILVTNYCRYNPDLFYIDCDMIFFCVVFNPYNSFLNNNMQIVSQILYYRQYQPFFAHGNGMTNMDDLVEGLGYTVPLHNFEKISGFLKYKKYIFYIIPEILPLMLILIMIVICFLIY
jgi:hypothetical protein